MQLRMYKNSKKGLYTQMQKYENEKMKSLRSPVQKRICGLVRPVVAAKTVNEIESVLIENA